MPKKNPDYGVKLDFLSSLELYLQHIKGLDFKMNFRKGSTKSDPLDTQLNGI